MNLPLLSIACLLVAAPAAAATTYTIHQVLPLSAVGPGGTVTLDTPVSLEVGDTLDIRYTFAGGARVTISGAEQIWPQVFGLGDAFHAYSGTLEVLEPGSNLLAGPLVMEPMEAGNAIGFLLTDAFRTGPGPVSFSGLRQVITLDGSVGPGGTIVPVTFFETGGLYTDGAVRFSSAVPEPASWALLIAGFGLMGARLRRLQTSPA
jgi:hypothetical protein